MKKRFLQFLFLSAFLCSTVYAAPVSNNAKPFRFAVMKQFAIHDENQLHEEMGRIEKMNLAFVIVNDIKTDNEPCTDALYLQRKNRLDESDASFFLSLSGNDWIQCTNDSGDSLAFERLQRLRNILFEDNTSLGKKKLPLTRQSVNQRFRDFSENAYWIYGNILFATINLPAANNHYSAAAGRNNEFEDRATANKNWIQRLFTLARRDQLRGIVLFSDGNPLLIPQKTKKEPLRDGFLEIRKQITAMAPRFSGRLLLVHNDPSDTATSIVWKDNLGTIGINSNWLEIGVYPDSNILFSVGKPVRAQKKKKRK